MDTLIKWFSFAMVEHWKYQPRNQRVKRMERNEW